MIALPTPASVPLGLLQAASTVADTIVTVAASSTGLQRWVDLMTSIASIVIALVLIVIAISLVPAAWNSRKLYRRINKAIEEVNDRSNPLFEHARNIADNLDYVSTAVRADAERLQVTVADAQARLVRAADLAEARINQFNALLEVVQDEAEDLFIDTASTIRGVQAGVRAIQHDGRAPRMTDEPLEIDMTGAASRPRRHP